MTFLIDTQCWLWWFASPGRLNESARRLIGDGGNEVFLSVASCWEMAIKVALGKLRVPEPLDRYVPSRLSAQGMTVLPVEMHHALQVAKLPAHHRDPFDRLLVAQAQMENLPILTADDVLSRYDVKIIPA